MKTIAIAASLACIVLATPADARRRSHGHHGYSATISPAPTVRHSPVMRSTRVYHRRGLSRWWLVPLLSDSDRSCWYWADLPMPMVTCD